METTPPLISPIPVGTSCTRHAARPAMYRCADCATYTCELCDLTVGAEKVHVCPACARRRNEGANVEPVRALPAPHGPPPPLPALNLKCVQHAGVAADSVCDTCGAGMCPTCRFDVPGGMHVCPVCAMAPKVTLSRKRKKGMILGFVFASIATGGMLLLLTGGMLSFYLNSPPFVAVILERLLTFFPALAGVALSVGSLDKKLGNPPALWAAAIWNMILLIGYVIVLIFAVLGM